MPEGDTVYRTARHLDQALAGATLTRSDFRIPQLAELDLSGELVEGVASVGKHLLTRVGDVSIHTHLKMEGSWHLYRPASRWKRPAYAARVVLETADWVAVGFDLGTVEVVARTDEAIWVPMCSIRAGTTRWPPRPCSALPRSPIARPTLRCSTSATSRASATSTPTSSAFCGASSRRGRSATYPICRLSLPSATGSSSRTATAPSVPRRETCGRAGRAGSIAARASRAVGAARASGRASWGPTRCRCAMSTGARAARRDGRLPHTPGRYAAEAGILAS
jgi:hypothetical protein